MRTPPDTFLQNVFAYRGFGGWYDEARHRLHRRQESTVRLRDVFGKQK